METNTGFSNGTKFIYRFTPPLTIERILEMVVKQYIEGQRDFSNIKYRRFTIVVVFKSITEEAKTTTRKYDYRIGISCCHPGMDIFSEKEGKKQALKMALEKPYMEGTAPYVEILRMLKDLTERSVSSPKFLLSHVFGGDPVRSRRNMMKFINEAIKEKRDLIKTPHHVKKINLDSDGHTTKEKSNK